MQIENNQVASPESVNIHLDKKKLLTCIGVVGWCDGAGLTSSAGASYNLDESRARAFWARSRCDWGLFGHFYSHLSFLSSFSLSF